MTKKINVGYKEGWKFSLARARLVYRYCRRTNRAQVMIYFVCIRVVDASGASLTAENVMDRWLIWGGWSQREIATKEVESKLESGIQW